MLSSAGKQLKQARLARHLSVEQVAHATRIRAERIVDLENDELSHFPDISYAKSFLVIYAKYLGVDVSDFTGTLGGPRKVRLEKYEYLQHATPASKVAVPAKPRQSPLLIIIAGGLLLLGIVALSIVPKLFQIGSFDQPPPKIESTPIPELTPPPTPVPTSTPETPTPTPTPSPIPTATPTPVPVASAIPVQTPEPTIEIRRAEPVRSVRPH